MESERVIDVKSLGFYYSDEVHALRGISLPVYKQAVTSLIGPEGCGKTTLLRCFNRMHDLYPGSRYEGEIYFDNTNILSSAVDLIQLRCKIGMVFQRPTPFPMTIFENVAYGLRLKGVRNKNELAQSVETALRHAVLWDEVKDSLHNSAYSLSAGQQQRLVIARSLAVRPEVLLFDEPASALDPVSTSKIEELAASLKKYYTVVIVTQNMQQAARISDWTGFMMLGELVEFGRTDLLFTNPSNVLTEDYISGRF
ncbi:MAG: phosphate ABC transporter ATP-binding protein PstB [Candidatus Magnetobacterium sp. LHC-1]|uniref:Phosphate ABC transporter ATP-binding protein n=1 Tax=Candidatus Magnetobacterium casense TaxID=1455061 RepID=A0ABS6RZ80_9BACT|nr:phosphate ABC transporter ATP-binding protein PstB [Candidatus Magnetobacterium casensis]MBF0608924.1 phosphate ABC transporter ATP-binding protein [Nitrospirota bacterium]MBV6341957.1 phosphate ABC transporter ATP-binding protein [Candidatus Magnetobacterium casensis]